MRIELPVTPRQAALLGAAQQRVLDMFNVIAAGTTYERINMLAVDTDRNIVIADVPEPTPSDAGS